MGRRTEGRKEREVREVEGGMEREIWRVKVEGGQKREIEVREGRERGGRGRERER